MKRTYKIKVDSESPLGQWLETGTVSKLGDLLHQLADVAVGMLAEDKIDPPKRDTTLYLPNGLTLCHHDEKAAIKTGEVRKARVGELYMHTCGLPRVAVEDTLCEYPIMQWAWPVGKDQIAVCIGEIRRPQKGEYHVSEIGDMPQIARGDEEAQYHIVRLIPR